MFNVLLSPFHKIGIAAVLVAVIFFAGYYKGFSGERDRFNAFKSELEAKAKAQDIINKATEEKNKLIADNVRTEYEAKLIALRNYYSKRMLDNNPNQLPTKPDPTYRVNEATTDPIFIGQCAETTLQLISLQDWIRKTN